MITLEQINQVIKTIIEEYKPKKIILFGSYVYGKPSKDSDLDILIINDDKLPNIQKTGLLEIF
ncbi:nucleotidyltransferase domain-containing protein [Candidatus Desantisbacteria bacterium]|nr:nucleotidyltransferase domain-containing protein [Candidatus Desantisbacteria bacterium]